ncbi:hypothetical protein KIPB_001728 [Kipferlia bialata]|uniref:Uncharacterized protein n=1 Tax=Kipferlia bialata TaxID=797122 RepID=A0A9K3GG52_9EUKA|nr:hypothetical protein KIPB_001728 [Kipferlia bialata]|eukprot:g1728.t1
MRDPSEKHTPNNQDTSEEEGSKRFPHLHWMITHKEEFLALSEEEKVKIAIPAYQEQAEMARQFQEAVDRRSKRNR